MDQEEFYLTLPKIELHAHLNGSLSQSTLLELKRYHADRGIVDKTNAFFDEFQVGAGDNRSLTELPLYKFKSVKAEKGDIQAAAAAVSTAPLQITCFQVFNIAHSLTNTPQTLALATKLTLQEYKDDGCCYVELRSTPKDNENMTKKKYVETIVNTIKESTLALKMSAKLIISINRSLPLKDAEEITDLAIECHRLYPEVVGIELSGNPMIGVFEEFLPLLEKARKAGLKVALHCGEVCNTHEVLEMLKFRPDRIGHGVCIHPKYGGTDETWNLLCDLKIPVEVCLTSNVNTKLTPDYDSHHFKELYNAGIPVIICTDDKGVFSTSLSLEYRLCADTFNLTNLQLAKLTQDGCKYIFDQPQASVLAETLRNFIARNNLI